MRLTPKTVSLVLSLFFFPSAVQAEEGADAADRKAAQDVLTQYLTAVKAKKWGDAKKLTHPKTLAAIAERKKRLGKEDHPMAPWALEKTDAYLTQFEVAKVSPGPSGTFIVETSEDNFQVQDKGVAEGEMASYLVGKSGGKWLVADKKRQETFSTASIRIGYKDFFDAPKGASSKEEEE